MIPRSVRPRASNMLLALALLGALIARAEAADTTTTSPGWVSSSDPSKANWHTRELLDQQQKATGKSQPTGGDEETIILDNYKKSLGKGGAGAALPPRDSQGQSRVER